MIMFSSISPSPSETGWGRGGRHGREMEWVGAEQSSAICETALAVTDTPGNKCLYKGVGKFAG